MKYSYVSSHKTIKSGIVINLPIKVNVLGVVSCALNLLPRSSAPVRTPTYVSYRYDVTMVPVLHAALSNGTRTQNLLS